MNRTVIAAASSVVAAVGVERLAQVTGRSPECLDAIRLELPDVLISAACDGISTAGVFGIAVAGAAVFLAVQFWQEIGSFVVDTVQPKRD